MTETGSFDFFRPKSAGSKPEAVLVVSPYVEAEFFTRIARELGPASLHVIIDDGCRREDLKTVTTAVAAGGYKRPVLLKLASTRGLVHIKLFYTRWRTAGGRTAHSLVFGSANATRQGFSGVDNGELVARCLLTAAAHSKVLDWCTSVIKATRAQGAVTIPAARDALLAPGMQLRLPAIVVGREVAAVSNFDLWLQRGYLLSDYRADPSFLRVQVPLLRPLPKGEQERLAGAAGFETPPTRSVRYRYINDGSSEYLDTEKNDLSGWRRRLFTWTQLGEWCSEDAFATSRDKFKRRSHQQREAALGELRRLQAPKLRDQARNVFMSKMDGLWQVLGEEASEFLRGKSKVDQRYYSGVFDDRVERDLALASDHEFERRYVTGFEFVSVPRFRNDVIGWFDFVDSLGRQIVLDSMQTRPRSRLLKAIRTVADEYDESGNALENARSLTAFLRRIWQPDAGPGRAAYPIAQYHEN